MEEEEKKEGDVEYVFDKKEKEKKKLIYKYGM